MGRRILLLAMSLLFVLTCALAEETPAPPPAAVQAEAMEAVEAAKEADFVELLLSVAIEELGYTEQKNGYTKYGEWSGDPYAQWCAEFLCWSVNQTDQRYGTNLLKVQYPLYSGSNTGRDWFISKGRYVDRRGILDNWGTQWFPGEKEAMGKNGYVPKPGDWMFFTWRSGRDTDHVAMVEYTDVNDQGQVVIHAIEGNNPSKVERVQYLLTDSKILGYGTVRDEAEVTMRSGNRGEKVRALQEKLVQLALLNAGDVDGTFGGKTAQAVKAFQSEVMVDKRASGIADMETQIAMVEEIERRLDSDPASWLVGEE